MNPNPKNDESCIFTVRLKKKKLEELHKVAAVFGISTGKFLITLVDYYLGDYERLPEDLMLQNFDEVQIGLLKDKIKAIERKRSLDNSL